MPDETADTAFIARKQNQSDQQVAQLYLAAHPERASAFGVETAAPVGSGYNAGPPGPDTAAAVEGSNRDPGVEAPTIDPTFVAADAVTGGLFGGAKAAIQAALESAGGQGVSGLAQQAAGKKTNSKIAQVASGILAPIALAVLTHRAMKSGGAETAESVADAAANADTTAEGTPQASAAGEAATPAASGATSAAGGCDACGKRSHVRCWRSRRLRQAEPRPLLRRALLRPPKPHK